MRNITMNNPNSKAIARVEHEEGKGTPDTMRITFRSGEVYDYPGVRLRDAVDLAWSEKPGRYFQKHFRKRDAMRVEMAAR